MKVINEKIEEIDISDIESITLLPNNYSKIKIHTINFYKIVKFIILNRKKEEFAENELSEIYNYIINNYETKLDPEMYEKVKNVLSIFVKNGGKIEIIYKTKDQVKDTMIDNENTASIMDLYKKITWLKLISFYGVLTLFNVWFFNNYEYGLLGDFTSLLNIFCNLLLLLLGLKYHFKISFSDIKNNIDNKNQPNTISLEKIKLLLFLQITLGIILGTIMPLLSIIHIRIPFSNLWPINVIIFIVTFIVISKRLLNLSYGKTFLLLILYLFIILGIFLVYCGGAFLLYFS